MTPRSEEHSSTIRSLQIDSAAALGRHAKVVSDVYIDFPADENSAPDLAILREDARREGKRYSFADVLLIPEVVSTSSARTTTTARRSTAGTASPSTWSWTPVALPDGRTCTLDLDELPLPDEGGTR
ncbi:hypothetical protein DSC45_33295 [Streptomyces sp. YIM 130001]|uniref:Uma2 family endonuclease n=1 Tax=Streptomyces sp. YIM 130001 TaxID=2259644 RepID=UPI000EC26E38|nr:Uma2 family endonuclease [Streptomyces sp. YIM 130001]RII08594.1 hypothetical protein DSC45_33295 [Streptomyces sp. YIM 130001]